MATRTRTTGQILQARIQKFSRVEKAFYGAIVLTAVILATSVVFMQTKLLQVQRDLTTVNSKIEAKRTEVNELIRSERLSKLASSQEMTQNNENIRTAE